MRIVERSKDIAIKLWKDESGASLLEYSVLIGLITAAAVGTIATVGTWVSESGPSWIPFCRPTNPRYVTLAEAAIGPLSA